MRLILGVIALVAIGFAIFSFLGSRDFVLKFSEEDLQSRIDEQMPFSKTYLNAVDVTLDEPRFDLIDGSDRLHGGMDVVLKLRVLGREVQFDGSADMSGSFHYRPEEGAFYLDQPRLENVEIDGLSKSMSNRANDALSFALQEFYEERPIYVLSDGDVKHTATKLLLKNVVVDDEKLIVTLGLNAEKSE